MRILVLGATGYVGSRLVPALLDAGHEVVAASSSAADPGRFSWGHQVTWRRCDVGDEAAVAERCADADGVCYLVHALRHRGFSDLRPRRRGPRARRRRRRPRPPPGLPVRPGSRPLERGQALGAPRLAAGGRGDPRGSDCSVLTLRAGVCWAPAPRRTKWSASSPRCCWCSRSRPGCARGCSRSRSADVVRAWSRPTRTTRRRAAVDLGGPDVVAYPDLLAAYARVARLPRLRIPAPVAPVTIVGLATAALVGAPFWTVTALVESLRHDMVCRPGHQWQPDGEPMLGVERRWPAPWAAAGPDVAEAPLPSDPAWTRMRAPVLDELHAPGVRACGREPGVATDRRRARRLPRRRRRLNLRWPGEHQFRRDPGVRRPSEERPPAVRQLRCLHALGDLAPALRPLRPHRAVLRGRSARLRPAGSARSLP